MALLVRLMSCCTWLIKKNTGGESTHRRQCTHQQEGPEKRSFTCDKYFCSRFIDFSSNFIISLQILLIFFFPFQPKRKKSTIFFCPFQSLLPFFLISTQFSFPIKFHRIKGNQKAKRTIPVKNWKKKTYFAISVLIKFASFLCAIHFYDRLEGTKAEGREKKNWQFLLSNFP